MGYDIINTRNIQSVSGKAADKDAVYDPSHTLFPHSGIMDRRSALERTMGDEAFLRDLLQEFIEDLPDIKVKIGNAINQKNASVIAKEANLLTGAAGNLGAVRLSNSAFGLEQIARKGVIDQANQAFRRLNQEIDRFILHSRAVELQQPQQLAFS